MRAAYGFDTYAQEPIMDCVGQRTRSAHFPFSPTA